MDSLAIIVTAHNMERTIRRTLQSVEDAISVLAANAGDRRSIPVAVIVVEDESTDGTCAVIVDFAKEKQAYRVVQTVSATSPACARNKGVACSGAGLLLFLDGDDLFLPDHLTECLGLMENDNINFVKTAFHMADPVHPDWTARIANSLVINLCVRRRCHDFIGGFLDYHLAIRDGAGFRHSLDIFYQLEDTYYNEMLVAFFRGAKSGRTTVAYCRHAGNAYDRHYERFCLPYAKHHLISDADEVLRHQIAKAVVARHVHALKSKRGK
jgi:glycosyltransferase involved in cell wall biosynthesis